MDINLILISSTAAVSLLFILLIFAVINRRANSKVKEYTSLSEAISKTQKKITDIELILSEKNKNLSNTELSLQETQKELSLANDKLINIQFETKNIENYKSSSEALIGIKEQVKRVNIELENARKLLVKTNTETEELQRLKEKSNVILRELNDNSKKLNSIIDKEKKIFNDVEVKEKKLHELMSKIDLYTRLDNFISHGLFEDPEYLYETSLRFAEEIKRIREKEKLFISNKTAVTYPETTTISKDKSYNKKILDGQVKLMLTAFNIECDSIISKISPSNFARTLERIEKLANNLEKSAATLNCGFNIDYVELKFQESKIQYQYKLKKQEEIEEQKLIREQIREEQKAIKEYDRAIAQSEKEGLMYRDMLDKAREELSKTSNEDRIIAEQRITDLERQLLDAESRKERAISMAEQTKRGHVYVISNIGSFGEGIYKIGLTRRLEPIERVKELSSASVPFVFDVHAMIYAENAPELETQLHREFTAFRVNAVNMRKEFFKTSLDSIREAVEKIAGKDAEFTTTIAAKEYYETRRLLGAVNVKRGRYPFYPC